MAHLLTGGYHSIYVALAATFQHRMMSIFLDMVGHIVEVFMDDFLIFGTSFKECLDHLGLILQHCEEPNLALNWEKMSLYSSGDDYVGYLISARGIAVDIAKIQPIEKLPSSILVKGIKSFLGHVRFYRISKISPISRNLSTICWKRVPLFTFLKDVWLHLTL